MDGIFSSTIHATKIVQFIISVISKLGFANPAPMIAKLVTIQQAAFLVIRTIILELSILLPLDVLRCLAFMIIILEFVPVVQQAAAPANRLAFALLVPMVLS